MLKEQRPGDAIAQSLLDRLTDAEPRVQTEAPLTAAESLRRFKNGIRHDLEWLLNTRCTPVLPDESYRQVNRSVFVYGTPDLSSFSMDNVDDLTRLQKAIQTVVRMFEPRISNARVLPLDPDKANPHVMRFRIEGLLRTQPVQRVSFDTVLQVANGEYRVKGDQDAG